MPEVRIKSEGTLRGVQASGSGRAWATAASPVSALYGYVQDGFAFTSAQTVVQIMERGVPDHNKIVERQGIKVTLSKLQVYQTGIQPFVLATASGSTVAMQHMEWKQIAPEIGNGTTAQYFQFYGVVPESIKITEDTKGNKEDYSFVCLGMNGPTGSGYLS